MRLSSPAEPASTGRFSVRSSAPGGASRIPAERPRSRLRQWLVSSRLYRDATWMVVGSGSWAVSRAALLAVVARAFSVTEVGVYGLALAVAAPVQLLSNMRLRHLVASDAGRRFSHETYQLVNLLTSLIAAGVIVAIGYLVRPGYVTVFGAVAVAKLAESLSEVAYGEMQRQGRISVIARAQVLRSVTMVGAAVAGAVLGLSLAGIIVLAAVAGLSVALVHDLPVSGLEVLRPRQARTTWSHGAWQVARVGLPLGVVALLVSLNSVTPRYLIEWQLGTDPLGRFVVLAYVTTAVGILYVGIGQAALGPFGTHASNGAARETRELADRVAAVSVAAGAVLGLAALLSGGSAVSLVFGSEYADSGPLLAGFMLWSGLAGAVGIFGHALTAHGSRGPQVIAALVSAVVGTLAAALLIPHLELWGAILGLLAGTLGAGVLLRRSLRVVETRGHRC